MLVGKGHIKITPTKSVQNPTTFNEIFSLVDDGRFNNHNSSPRHYDPGEVSLNPSLGSIFLYLFVPGLFNLCENP